MKIVIAGCGKIGTTIIKYLCNEGHSITVIDKDKKIIEDIINTYDVGGVVGNATSATTLKEANVQKCHIFISVSGNDEINFVSCRVAKAIGAKKVIARVRDTDYTDQAEFMRETFDIDRIINPEFAVANEIYSRLRFPYASSVFSFEKGRAVSIEFKVPENSSIANKTILEFVKAVESNVVFGAISHNGELIIPNGETMICGGDTVNLISTPANIDSLFKKLGIFSQKAKSVFIVGGSRIAYHLARLLDEVGGDVKILEKRETRCRQLIEKLDSNVEIVQADGTNEQILAEEGIDSYDACLTLTGHDEENILISLSAKNNKVGTVITKVNNDKLDAVLDKLELNRKISTKNVTVDQVLYFIRSIKAKEENTIESLRKTMDGNLEILELNVNDNEDFVNKAIKDLKIKTGVLIASIIRKNKVIVPNGDVVFEGDDKIIIVTKSNNIKSLDRILK